MANGGDAVFTVTNPIARRLAVMAMMQAIAGEVLASAAANGPVGVTGLLSGGYSIKPGRDPGTTLITIHAPKYHKYVEYGTRHMAARAPLGRAFAAAKAAYGG